MTFSYRCPHCNSEDTQSIPTIYADGTAITRSTSFSSGNTFFTASSFDSHYPQHGTAYSSATTQHTGKTQSALAARFSPPSKRKVYPFRMALLFFAATTIISGLTNNSSDQLIDSMALLYLGYIVLRGLWAGSYNLLKYPGRMKAWQHSMLCRRCGQAFVLR